MVFFGAAMLLFSCATSSALKEADPKQEAPLWVNNKGAAYPEAEWMCAVESRADRETAEAAALAGLVGPFQLDVKSVTETNQRFRQMVEGGGGKETFTQSKDFEQELTATSNVAGLVGVERDFWTAGGDVYAIARMNRKECAARYSAMIRENSSIIRSLKEEAERMPGTFEAFENLNSAANFAAVTDNFQKILSVLDPSTVSNRLEYGNADAILTLAQNAAREIIITVTVSGDEDGRIANAFSKYFGQKGFRTIAAAGTNPYVLRAQFIIEDVDMPNDRFKFSRYKLQGSIEDKKGVKGFTFSDEHRDGGITFSEAKKTNLRKAEAAITTGTFAKAFDEYLDSLLK
jgi:hypothetical protein